MVIPPNIVIISFDPSPYVKYIDIPPGTLIGACMDGGC
jgi:hypothetical protein